MREKMETEGSDTVRMGSHHLRLQHRPQVRHRGGQSLAMHFSSGGGWGHETIYSLDATALAYLSYEDPFSPLYSA